MLPSLVQLPIGTFVEWELRNGTPASLEAIDQLECSICYQTLGDGDGWLVPCVNHHAFHRQCLADWVRQSAPNVGGFDSVKCPDCTTVLTYPNDDDTQYRQIAMQATAMRVLPQRMQHAAARQRLQWLQQREAAQVAQEEAAHPRVARGPQDMERDRNRAKDLSLLDWWSATFDGMEPSPSVVDPAPNPAPRRRIQLYPSVLTQAFELATYGLAEKRRRGVVAERNLAMYEAAWRLVKDSVYGPRGMELMELHDAEQIQYGVAQLAPPSRELRQWIDQYRVREREILEAVMEEGVAEEARLGWAYALRYLEGV